MAALVRPNEVELSLSSSFWTAPTKDYEGGQMHTFFERVCLVQHICTWYTPFSSYSLRSTSVVSRKAYANPDSEVHPPHRSHKTACNPYHMITLPQKTPCPTGFSDIILNENAFLESTRPSTVLTCWGMCEYASHNLHAKNWLIAH